jgi:hypothetical protein
MRSIFANASIAFLAQRSKAGLATFRDRLGNLPVNRWSSVATHDNLSRRAVLRALPPMALGHALSIGIVAGVVWLAQLSFPGRSLRVAVAVILLGFGLYRLIRSRHPAWVGMRVGFRDLTLWSFLMASPHGAGLMLIPVLVGMGPDHTGHPAATADDAPMEHSAGMDHAAHIAAVQRAEGASAIVPLAAVAVHTLAMLLVSAAIAILVYEKLGLAILRRAWLNLDMIWAVSLLAAGVLVLVEQRIVTHSNDKERRR